MKTFFNLKIKFQHCNCGFVPFVSWWPILLDPFRHWAHRLFTFPTWIDCSDIFRRWKPSLKLSFLYIPFSGYPCRVFECQIVNMKSKPETNFSYSIFFLYFPSLFFFVSFLLIYVRHFSFLRFVPFVRLFKWVRSTGRHLPGSARHLLVDKSWVISDLSTINTRRWLVEGVNRPPTNRLLHRLFYLIAFNRLLDRRSFMNIARHPVSEAQFKIKGKL